MNQAISSFEKDLDQFHIYLNEKQMNQFIKYFYLLTEWNSFINLTAITEFDQVLKKHFADSLSLIQAISDLGQKPYCLIDVGTGAGFPGIPLKIAFPNIEVVLLDSLNKRVLFLEKVIQELELQNIAAIHGRAEDYGKQKDYRERFDLCVSRAVANMTTLSEYCIPFVKKGGYFISYKSEKAAEEYEQAKNAIEIFGGKFEKQVAFKLPFSDIDRNLFVIRKVNHTPNKFPRKAGLASKDPILK